jgi:hypothetical protein
MKSSRRTGLVFLGAFIVLSHRPAAFAQSASAPTGHPAPAADASSNSNPEVNLADVDSVLSVAIPRTLRNRRQSLAYTYAVDQRNRNFNLRGKPLVDYTARYEVIFVGDLPYRRQIEENHRPLAGEAASEEERRLDRTFAERSRMSLDQKRDYLRRPWNIDVPLPQIPTLFTSRILGEELVNERPAIVVESIPRADAHPTDEEDRRALHKEVKLWIDRHDLIVSRLEATLIADDAAMKAGTVARIDFDRKDGVWLPIESDVRFEAASGSEVVRGETREANSDFHRFHVDVRLLEPAEAAGNHQAQ